MKQFIPYKGVYVIARQLGEHGVIVLLNGTSEGQAVNTLRYSELYKRKDKKSDYENGAKVKFGGTMYLKPRQTLILEY